MAKEGVGKQELMDSIEEALDEQQQISLNETDDDLNSHAVRARKVTIVYSGRSAAEQVRHHSHYLVTKPCIEYKWEKQFYHGHLIAFHMSRQFFAYCLQTHHSGKVRVTSDDGDRRCLLKEFDGQLVDIDFAHVPDAIYIACMEQNGWCTVFAIHDLSRSEEDDKSDKKKKVELTYELLVKIRIDAEGSPLNGPCRAMWCVHVPENGRRPVFTNENDPSNRLILTTNGKVVVASVPVVMDSADGDRKVVVSTETPRGVATTAAGARIWDTKMSPDGVVLCVAREDGNVHFYQCVLEKGEGLVENVANLVYTWTPHDGRPVHTIHFFDDFSPNTKQDQFWMFALSGCEFGRQFRIWNCQHWYCLQTIDIEPAPSRPKELPMLHVTVDPQGNYLIAGDSERGLLMYFRVDKDLTKRVATVTSVNEFVTGSPILNVVAAKVELVRDRADENGFKSGLLTLHSNLLQHMDVSFAGEMLVNKIAQRKELLYEDPAVAFAKKSTERNSPVEINGEPKVNRKKKPKKERDAYATLDDIPTPTTPEVDFTANGDDLYPVKSEDEEVARTYVSPDVVLQPPSVFDADGSFEGGSDLSLLGTPMVVKNVCVPDLESDTIVDKSMAPYFLQRENSGNNLLNNFGAPPVEELCDMVVESPSKSFSREPRAIPSEYGGRNGRPAEIEASRDPRLLDRLDKLEQALTAMSGVIQQQADMVHTQTKILDRVAAAVELMKTMDQSASGSGDRDEVFKHGFNAIVQSIRPLQELHGIEGRVIGAVDGLGKTLEGNLGKEIKNQFMQNTEKAWKPLGEKLKTDVMGKLGTLDTTIRQKFDEAVRNPQFFAVTAQALAPQFADIARQAAQEGLNQTVRSYQDILNSSLATLNQTFTNGTKEYLGQVNHSLEAHFVRMDSAFDDRVRMVEQATERSVASALETSTNQMTRQIQQIVEQNVASLSDRILQTLSNQITQNVNNIVKSEMREGQNLMHESVMQALRSGVATPAPKSTNFDRDLQQTMQEIEAFLSTRDYNSAFRTALSANNLKLVVSVCEKCDVKEVFGNPQNLKAPVLLSLIQQLTVDLTSKTELKIQYLEEAMLAVRCEDLVPNSWKFLRTVLTDAVKGFSKFLKSNPDHPLKGVIRLMANQANLQLNYVDAQAGSRGSN